STHSRCGPVTHTASWLRVGWRFTPHLIAIQAGPLHAHEKHRTDSANGSLRKTAAPVAGRDSGLVRFRGVFRSVSAPRVEHLGALHGFSASSANNLLAAVDDGLPRVLRRLAY